MFLGFERHESNAAHPLRQCRVIAIKVACERAQRVASVTLLSPRQLPLKKIGGSHASNDTPALASGNHPTAQSGAWSCPTSGPKVIGSFAPIADSAARDKLKTHGGARASIWAADRAQRFYVGVALFGLIAIAVGFSTTYFIPMARRTFTAPGIVHLHGVAAFSWVCVLLSQALLVRDGRTKLHMRLGQTALPLAVLTWSSGILTAAWAARRDIPSQGLAAETGFVGTLSGLSLFLPFVIAGYVTRRSPAAHKRWMALATIAVLWPAVFRWRHLLPSMSRPDIILGLLVADLPILVAMLRDRLRYGLVHPVWLLGGTFWFVEQGIEVAAHSLERLDRQSAACGSALNLRPHSCAGLTAAFHPFMPLAR